ncbi:MAG: hypothetical protein L0221_12035 [Chloroflexi bacterium]|nr:hypothetical protein [Chloroflexota bacterium]
MKATVGPLPPDEVADRLAAWLRSERESLVEECRAVGVDVAHLPETAKRLEEAARAKERASATAEALAARAAELDDQHVIETGDLAASDAV